MILFIEKNLLIVARFQSIIYWLDAVGVGVETVLRVGVSLFLDMLLLLFQKGRKMTQAMMTRMTTMIGTMINAISFLFLLLSCFVRVENGT